MSKTRWLGLAMMLPLPTTFIIVSIATGHLEYIFNAIIAIGIIVGLAITVAGFVLFVTNGDMDD